MLTGARKAKLPNFGPITQKRGIRRLPRLEYNPHKGVPPVFSETSGKYVYDSIHRAAAIKFNQSIEGTMDETKPLEDVIVIYRSREDAVPAANASSTIWNWTVFWMSIYPNGRRASDWLLNYFDVTFGGIEKFKKLWKANCMNLFGSGWVWLVDNNGFLEIVTVKGTGSPVGLVEVHPILTINLWEHAYFHDFGHDREAYVEAYLGAVNWLWVESKIRSIKRSQRVETHPDNFLPMEQSPIPDFREEAP